MNGITPFRSVLLTLIFAFSFLVFLAWPGADSLHSRAFLLVAALVQAVLLSGPVLLRCMPACNAGATIPACSLLSSTPWLW